MAVFYKWDVETMTSIEKDNHKKSEIVDRNCALSFAHAMSIASTAPDEGMAYQVVLVRDDDKLRSWAYLSDMSLPSYFEDAYQNYYGKVPKRFHNEVAAYKLAATI